MLVRATTKLSDSVGTLSSMSTVNGVKRAWSVVAGALCGSTGVGRYRSTVLVLFVLKLQHALTMAAEVLRSTLKEAHLSGAHVGVCKSYYDRIWWGAGDGRFP